MQCSPISQYFISLRSRYSPQHPVFKHPQSVVPPVVLGTKFHTHTELQVISCTGMCVMKAIIPVQKKNCTTVTENIFVTHQAII
jgi:hypothetical protein